MARVASLTSTAGTLFACLSSCTPQAVVLSSCSIENEKDWDDLKENASANCMLIVRGTNLESLDGVPETARFPVVILGDNDKLDDIDSLLNADVGDLSVSDTALSGEQLLPATLLGLSVRGVSSTGLETQSTSLPRVQINESAQLRSIRLPAATRVGGIHLRELAVLDHIDVSSLNEVEDGITIVGCPMLANSEIEKLTSRFFGDTAQVTHCGNLEDGPC